MPVATRRRRTSAGNPSSAAAGRSTTSAIPSVSVSELRKALESVRRGWAERREKGFELSAPVYDGLPMSVQHFCVAYLLGQQKKRAAARR